MKEYTPPGDSSPAGRVRRALRREVIQPFHKDLCRHIRRLLPETVIEFHTEGSVFRLLPDLIASGVQMLEAVQVECFEMEPVRLKNAFGDQLMFQGAVSVQTLLPCATESEVRGRVRELINILGEGGGYLPAPSHAIQVGTPPENVVAMLQEILGPERWRDAWTTATHKA